MDVWCYQSGIGIRSGCCHLPRTCQALQVFTHRLAQLAAPLAPSAAADAPAAQRRREGLRMLQPGDKPEVGDWIGDVFLWVLASAWARMGVQTLY